MLYIYGSMPCITQCGARWRRDISAMHGHKTLLTWSCEHCLFAPRVGLKLSSVEVRFQDLSIDTNVRVGKAALPSVPGAMVDYMLVSLHEDELHACLTCRCAHAAHVGPGCRRSCGLCLQWPLSALGIRFGRRQKMPILKGCTGILHPVNRTVTCRPAIGLSN